MKKNNFVLFTYLIVLTGNLYAYEPDSIAYEFDYPIGNRGYSNNKKVPIDEQIQNCGNGRVNVNNKCSSIRATNSENLINIADYNKIRNEQYTLEKYVYDNNDRWSGDNGQQGWYNYNDTGAFGLAAEQRGLHPGEDWNRRGGDTGLDVYAVADGVIQEISSVATRNPNNRGWQVIIKHRLPDTSYIYSIYMHVTSDTAINGNVSNNETDFSFSEGDQVDKGDVIAKIAARTVVPSHLHFEIRNKFTSGANLFINANTNGYYTHSNDRNSMPTSMTKTQVLTAINKMKIDGVFDPSDFIDDHRDIWFWTGNASIISNHKDKLQTQFGNSSVNTDDSQYPFGITQDISKSHIQTQKPVAFFQWQVSASCTKLTIDYDQPDVATTVYNDKLASITIGYWSPRKYDLTFENISLPFTLGEKNTNFTFANNGKSWYVISVALENGVLGSRNISATCTDDPESMYIGNPVRGKSVIVDGYKWNGNASIISRIYSPSWNISSAELPFVDWPFGAFKDVTEVHKSQYNPIVFFQWMSDDKCNQISIDAPSLPSSEKEVTLKIKGWADNNYSEKRTSLPATIKSDGRLWTVIGIAFDTPVTVDSKVEAKCPDLYEPGFN